MDLTARILSVAPAHVKLTSSMDDLLLSAQKLKESLANYNDESVKSELAQCDKEIVELEQITRRERAEYEGLRDSRVGKIAPSPGKGTGSRLG
jgi:hypothetical protein